MKPTFGLAEGGPTHPHGLFGTGSPPSEAGRLSLVRGTFHPPPLSGLRMLSWLLLLTAAVAADPHQLLDETRQRARVGDFDGAVITARQAVGIPGPHARQADYLLALSLEYSGSLEEALALYDALLATGPDDDAAFRRAETLGRLRRWSDARDALRRLGPADQRPAGDQMKITVLLGLWEIERGHERRGLKALHAALDGAASSASPFYQGRARARIAELALNASETMDFRGGDRKKARTLERRAQHVVDAKEQLEAVIALDEPAATLPTLAAVARAHASFAEALMAEPPLRRLNADQQASYTAQLEERAEALFVKALRYYTKGVEYGHAVGWSATPVPEMVSEIDRITARVDTLR